jgi:hypothetical protein
MTIRENALYISKLEKVSMEVNMVAINSKILSSSRAGKSLAPKLFMSLSLTLSLLSLGLIMAPGQLTAPAQAAPAAAAKTATDKDKAAATDKEKKEASKTTPEPVIENVVNVQAETLVDHPAEYLNKNVKFTALFYNYNSLATDYKPAMRSSKNYLSFSVFREHSKVPLSELKLAMVNPKDEKDKLTAVLLKLKEKDEIEVTGKVFNTALDEPWVDVLKLTIVKAAPDDKKADASATPTK